MTPTISTARLTLRHLKVASRDNLAWLRDPEVTKYSNQRHEAHTVSTQLRYVTSFVGRSHLWGIYLIETGQHVGNISAVHDEPNNIANVGIMIGEPKCWGTGIGKEAWQPVCAWLLDEHCGGMRKIEAGCMKNNLAMVKIIRGSGFKQEGEVLNHFLFGGNPISMMLYGRMR